MARTLAFQAKGSSQKELNTLPHAISRIGQSSDDTKTVAVTKDHLYVLLQTSLDLNELLTLFKKEAHALVNFDSFHYQNRTLDMRIDIGDQRRNSCTYRLLTQEDYLGELVFSRKARFNEEETKTLETLICTIIYPIRNALQYREAMRSALTDALTGAGNRISLNNALKREFDLSRRYQQPLSVLMVDLDHFKSINDTHGHAAGDTVLRTVAKEIQNTGRCADMTFRYGGEEFVVVLNKTDKDGAHIAAERLRAAIAGLSCSHGDIKIPVTASIGCTTLNAVDDVDDLIERADKALYEAKTKGRNRVCFKM